MNQVTNTSYLPHLVTLPFWAPHPLGLASFSLCVMSKSKGEILTPQQSMAKLPMTSVGPGFQLGVTFGHTTTNKPQCFETEAMQCMTNSTTVTLCSVH